MRDDFAVFILTHGRCDNITTIKALNESNYTGTYYLVIDNEDEQVEKYINKFGDKVIVFDKREVAKRIDTADNVDDRLAIVFARNYVFDIAEKLGIKYFLQLDDDFLGFYYRFAKDGELKQRTCRKLDAIINYMIDLLEETGALTVTFAQAGDFVGGVDCNNYKTELLRKAMNTFFCKTSNRFKFSGRLCEDVCTYTDLTIKGNLFFTVTDFMIRQTETQKNDGGMSKIYIDSGTYLKSFYPMLFCPSCVKISEFGDKYKRIHHAVAWNNCAPKILNERYKK